MSDQKLENDVEDEEDSSIRKRISHVLIVERRKGLGTAKELTLLINSLQEAIKKISQQVRRYGLFRGIQVGKSSFKSFDQRNLLKKCEGIFVKTLQSLSTVCLIGSSFGNELLEVNNPEHGKFIVTFVPLEGNSSLNYCLVSGSIFSIYKKQGKDPVNKDDFMQHGGAIVAAGYALYGIVTTFVFAPAPGVGLYEFTLDPDTNDFILTNPKLEIPTHGNTYAMNEGRSRALDHTILEAVNKKKSIQISRGKPYKCCYTGCVTADMHTIIKEGGVLFAPPYNDYPEGMLKQQFYGNPLAFIIIEARGAASDGRDAFLDTSVDDPHQNRPLLVGSTKEHMEFQRILFGMMKISRINIHSYV